MSAAKPAKKIDKTKATFGPEDVLVNFGGTLKALGVDGDKAKVGGYLIRWGSPQVKDATGEYFSEDTYLGPKDGDGQECLFHHSQPIKGAEELCDYTFNPIATKRDKIGVWAETVLDMHNQYEAKVYEMVKQGVLGWSSGSAAHRVRKAPDGKILAWPVVEGSLTPEPCEPLNNGGVVALKYLASVKYKKIGSHATKPKQECPVTKKIADMTAEEIVAAKGLLDGISGLLGIGSSDDEKKSDLNRSGDDGAYEQNREEIGITVKGDGSETDYEVQDQDETGEGYPGSGKAQSALDPTLDGACDGDEETGTEEDETDETKADYALYEANRIEGGVTGATTTDNRSNQKDDGEVWGHNVGPARVSVGLAKSLASTVKFLAEVATTKGLSEAVTAGARYHLAKTQEALKSFRLDSKPAKRVMSKQPDIKSLVAQLSPEELEGLLDEIASEAAAAPTDSGTDFDSTHAARRERALS
jgi:hypothetical protein